MDNIPEVADSPPRINTAEFIKLTVFNEYGNVANTNVYTFSSAYRAEVIDGVTYLPMGGLLAVGVQNRDLRVTSSDTTIALSGISGNNIPLVLGTKIRGSEMEIIRGFYDDNYELANTYPRFTGIITNYAILNDREDIDDNFTVSVSASSYRTIFENRVAGRYTNQESWQTYSPGDNSMNNVYSIAGRTFDFGKPVVASGGGGTPRNPFEGPVRRN